MGEYFADLHIHSCLSPCGDDDMTPGNIVGMAALNSLQIAALTEEIRLAARDYDPSRINKYVTELAARFHRFYTVCRIKDAEPALMDARLVLADTVRRVIAIPLSIIGVSATEKM